MVSWTLQRQLNGLFWNFTASFGGSGWEIADENMFVFVFNLKLRRFPASNNMLIASKECTYFLNFTHFSYFFFLSLLTSEFNL